MHLRGSVTSVLKVADTRPAFRKKSGCSKSVSARARCKYNRHIHRQKCTEMAKANRSLRRTTTRHRKKIEQGWVQPRNVACAPDSDSSEDDRPVCSGGKGRIKAALHGFCYEPSATEQNV